MLGSSSTASPEKGGGSQLQQLDGNWCSFGTLALWVVALPLVAQSDPLCLFLRADLYLFLCAMHSRFCLYDYTLWTGDFSCLWKIATGGMVVSWGLSCQLGDLGCLSSSPGSGYSRPPWQAAVMAPCLGSCHSWHTHGLCSQLPLSLAWPRPGCFGHLRNEESGRVSISLSVSQIEKKKIRALTFGCFVGCFCCDLPGSPLFEKRCACI